MIRSVLPRGDVGIASYGSKYSGFSTCHCEEAKPTWQSNKKSSVFAGNDVKNETNPQDCHDPCGVSQ